MDPMQQYIQLTSKTAGRDKVLRLIQYFSKLLSGSMESRKINKELVEQLKAAESMLSMSRKTFRLGKTFDMLHGSYISSISVKQPTLCFFIVCCKLTRAVYFYYDTMSWLIKLGIQKGNLQQCLLKSARFWCAAIICSLIRDLYELQNYIKVYIRTSRENSVGEKMKDLIFYNVQVLTDMLKNLFDLVLALKMMGSINVSNSFLGFSGVLSSSLGLLEIVYPQFKLIPS